MKTWNTINHTRSSLKQFALGVAVSAVVVFGSGLTARADYSNTVKSLNPIGYWRLNEPAGSGTATNIGSALATGNAAYIASPTLQQPGALGPDPAALFDGTSQYASVPYAAAFNPPGSFTVGFWAKKTAAGSSTTGAIFSRDPAASGQNGWLFFANNGNDQKWWFRTYANNVRASVISGNPMVLNQWTHVVGVHDATGTGTNYLYVDGVLAALPVGNAVYTPNASYPMFFAAWADTATPPVPGSYFPGLLDEIAFFDKALTPAQVQVLYGAEPPTVTQQPQAPTGPLYGGMAFSLSVAVNGNPPFAYQWRTNGTAIPGKTGPDLVVTNLTMANNGEYTVVITNAYGSVTSSPVQITVQAGPPIFTAQPQAAQCFAGGSATFSVSALGSAPLSYQWYFSTPTATNLIAGATSSSYTVANVGSGDVGNYSARVTNPYGNTNSAKAALTLVPVTGHAAEVVESGPASYWRFSETTGTTAVDYMGGKNGTNVSVVTGAAGPQPSSLPISYVGMEAGNKAYTFDGTNSEVRLPASFALNRSAFSIMAWVRVASDPAAGYHTIMAQGANLWRLQLTPGGLLELVTSGLNRNSVTTGNWIADGYWHQVVASYDGRAISMYVDGSPDTTMTASGLLGTNSDMVRIGSQGSTRWLGELDEVAVYNRGLSGPEVLNLYWTATSTTVLAPQIGAEPVSQTVYAGQPASFSVAALGGAPYTYQWKRDGTNLPAATKRVLTIPSAHPTHVGTYSVTVNNSVGPAVNSRAVGLTVLPPPYIDVSGAGVIGDTTLTTVAGVAKVPVDGVNWRADGGGGVVYSSLTSPAFTVPATHVNGGMVTLKFTHRYNLELGWDGGAVYVSKNGAGAPYVDASAFTANGYAGPVPGSSVWTGGESVFNNISAGWGAGTLIESVATLGPVNQGDTLAITFKGGWDEGYNQATDPSADPGAPGPGWEIGTFQLRDSSTAVFSSVNFMTDGPAGFTVVSDPGLGGPWNYLRSTFRFEINGDTLAADRYKPDIAGSVIDLTGVDLSVVLLAGSLDVGDSFALFDLSGGTTLRGSYRSIALPPGTWNVSNLGVNGTIVFVAYPPIRSFDVNSGSSPTQFGYSALNDTLNGTSYGITVATTVVCDGTSGYADRGAGYSDLLRDLFYANGNATPPVLTFNLTGLPPNTRYAINMCSFNGGASQRVSKWYQNAVAGVPLATHLTQNTADNAYFTLDLTSDSTGKITFVGTSDDPTGKSVVVNGLTIALAGPSEVFSVNFYAAGGGAMAAANVAAVENLKLNPSLTAGVGDWSTTSWRNYTVPWAPATPQAPVTLESSRGSTAIFTLKDCRNGGPYVWDAPRTTLLNDGNGNLMDGHVNSTFNPGDSSYLFDMEVLNIPFAFYDVIFYMGANAAQYGDGTGKIVFNGAPERDFTVKPGPFDGTFTEMVDATTPGNYIVYKMLTGSSFTTQTWGTGPNNGFNHIGPTGFQIREATLTLPIPTFVNGVPTFTGVPSVSGFTYWLAYKSNLTDPSWTRIGAGTPGTGGNLILTDTVAPYPAHRFYRLEVQ